MTDTAAKVDVEDETTEPHEVPLAPSRIDRLEAKFDRLTTELSLLTKELRRLVVKLDNHFERYPMPQEKQHG